MPAGPWTPYDNVTLEMLRTMDFDADTFKVALVLSGYTPNVATHTAYGDLTNEHANGNGYTTGGWTLTNQSLSESSGDTTFDSDNPTWSPSGGAITARYAVLYNDTVSTPVSKPLLAYCLLDTTSGGQDVSKPDGDTFEITLPTNGYFRLLKSAA